MYLTCAVLLGFVLDWVLGLSLIHIYLAPSQFEAMFVSSAHTQNDLACTVQAVEESIAALA